MPRRRGGVRPGRIKRKRGRMGGPSGPVARRRSRSKRKPMGNGMPIGMSLPNIPPSAKQYNYAVRIGGSEGSGRADMLLCPGPKETPECIKMTDVHKRIIANGRLNGE